VTPAMDMPYLPFLDVLPSALVWQLKLLLPTLRYPAGEGSEPCRGARKGGGGGAQAQEVDGDQGKPRGAIDARRWAFYN
jgi:hypothetical protein